MKKLVLILGGARSGKSSYAIELAKRLKKSVIFIATASALDEEMRERIKLHKTCRPRQWKLVEEEEKIDLVLSNLDKKYEVVLIDCLGLLISNLLAHNLKDKEIGKRIKELISAILKLNRTVILVSNEVGAGIVPENPLARRFRDLLGSANQIIAEKVDEVILMQSGIPLKIKN